MGSWSTVAVSEEGRGKVAAILKKQGLNVKGLTKSTPAKEEPQPFIDCTGNLYWRVNGTKKKLLSGADTTKFYSGDCYIFQYTYPGDDTDEILIGTWFGRKSIEDERSSAISLATKMNEALKSQAVQGDLSPGYRNYITENGISDNTYSEEGLALFRIQGSGPDNMQAIQVDTVEASLNSSYSYLLHDGNTVFTWSGGLAITLDLEFAERQLDVIKPNLQTKRQKKEHKLISFGACCAEKQNILAKKDCKRT